MFVSCVLEYVPDLEAALAEIARIAGSAENVFIVNVQPWTLTARLYPNARWRGTTSAGSKVDMRPVGLDEKLVATGVVGALAAAANLDASLMTRLDHHHLPTNNAGMCVRRCGQ